MRVNCTVSISPLCFMFCEHDNISPVSLENTSDFTGKIYEMLLLLFIVYQCNCKGCVVLQIIQLLYYLITYLYLHIVALQIIKRHLPILAYSNRISLLKSFHLYSVVYVCSFYCHDETAARSN